MGKTEPKILFLDLEILPNLDKALKHWVELHSFNKFDNRLMKAQVTSICCFGYKFYNESKAKVINAWDFPAWETDVNDDYELCKEARKLFEGVDAVVHQNGDRFDMPYFNTKLLEHGLEPLPPLPTIDLKKLCKKHLFLLSNSLKNQSGYITGESKLNHGEGWELWVKTHKRIKKYMNLMSKYCAQDVDVMEPIFKKLRPYIKNIPNHNLFNAGNQNICPPVDRDWETIFTH